MRRMRLLAAAAVALFALAGTAAAHPDAPEQHGGTGGHLPPSSLNVQLVGKLRVSNAGPSRIADVAGFRNYAYTAWRNTGACEPGRVNVIDISNPANPVEVGVIPSHAGSFPGEGLHVIHVDTPSFTGDILAHNNETCSAAGLGGVSLWDVTNPLSPQPLALNFGDTKDNAGATVPVREYHSVFAWQQGGRAFVVASDDLEQATNDVDIFEITNPRDPKLVAEVGLPDWPDAQSPLALGDRAFNHDMVVEKIGNTWTLLSSYWDAGYIKLNVNDPANPVFIDDSDFSDPDPETGVSPAEGNGHYAEFDRRGRFIIGTDEDFAPYRTKFEITTGPNAGPYGAGEFGFTVPMATKFPAGFTGRTVWGGSGCEEDVNGNGTGDRAEVLATARKDQTGADAIVFTRGTCFFSKKIETGELAGYEMVLIGNSHAGSQFGAAPDAFVCGGAGSPVLGKASAICIGHRAMHLLFNVAPAYTGGDTADMPAIGTLGESIRAEAVFDGWGYIHLFDAATLREIDTYAVPQAIDPAFATGFGTMSVHEVTFSRNSDIAYLAWYDAGFRVVSFGQGGIREVGHFIDMGGNDFWGVQLHKAPDGTELVLASDRDSGLYVFRYTGPRRP